MSELLIYSGKILVIQAVFYGFYRLVLRHSVRHGWNRMFLLAALVVSFVIPFIQIPDHLPVQPLEESPMIVWVQESAMEFEMVPVKKESRELTFTLMYMLPWLYVLVACYLIGRSTMYLFFIQKLKKHSEYVKKRWFKLFRTSQTLPFSFFSNVFIPKDIFGSDAFDKILAHECVHVKQRHSIDRLLMDFLVSLFWFNPFIYLYRNALIEIHEFQADEAVINQFNDPVGYQEVLYAQLQHATYSGLVSHFNFSMIKKRIVMMNKQKNRYAELLYALILPVLVSVIFAFSSKEAIDPIERAGNELAEILSPDPIFKLPVFNLSELKAQTQQKDNVPSILPLKESDMARMTSGFGKRMHPIKKVEQWHFGMDFSCPIGSEILATANGVVESIEEKPKGYGKRIVIDHGNEYKTRYAQLSEFRVKEGEQVKKGQLIALSGSSGMSTGPHLHYEIQKGEKRVNPVHYIKDYDFKIDIKESGNVKQQAQKETKQTRDVEVRANEILRKTSEEERKAFQLEKESEERRLMDERIKQEKLRFEDANQTRKIQIIPKGNPLYVVDGEIIDDVSDVEPPSIEHINVLKGEKATDKYGEKGEGGVIEITTKDQSKNKSKEKEKIENNSDVLINDQVRLLKAYQFLKDYDDNFDPDNWNIVLKSDRVKLKRVGSIEAIVLFDKYFEKEQF